jgi:xanthine dehydrogenase small subunit
MRDHIILYVNGQRRELRGAAVFQSLSDYLRNDLGLTGTKVVCSEGDCGSCTVLVGRARNGSVEYHSLCSCIQFVFQADGCHVVTVEGLGSNGDLDPVQQAIVQHQATQCGLCTPGIVMSIHALLESDPVLSEQRLRQGLVGNLCRCTGYDPIVRAGLQVDGGRTLRMNDLFNSPAMLEELARSCDQPVCLESAGRIFFKPGTIAEAAKFKAAHPDCVIVSGGTDLGVQVNKGVREIRTVLSTAALAELRELRIGKDEILAGANLSISELERAATEALPEYAALMARFGSPQIKNAATLGGNIANSSPIGDTMPALFVLNAQIELSGANGSRRVNINDFYTGYKKTVASADELITRVSIPRLRSGEVLRLFKVSKRQDLDISTFSAAIWLKLSGRSIQDVRIAYGGVAPTIVRLLRTEAHMKGSNISAETFDSAGKVALSEISPISDVRGSATYRNLLASNILRKLYYDLVADQAQASTA